MDYLRPIKWLLRKKVIRYRILLKEITDRSVYLAIKSRRKGTAERTSALATKDAFNQVKYLNFIKRWEILDEHTLSGATLRRQKKDPCLNKKQGKWYIIDLRGDNDLDKAIDLIVFNIARHIMGGDDYNILQLYTVKQRDVIFLHTDNEDILGILGMHWDIATSGIPNTFELLPLIQQSQ